MERMAEDLDAVRKTLVSWIWPLDMMKWRRREWRRAKKILSE